MNMSCKALKCIFLPSSHFLIPKVRMAGLFEPHERLEGCFCSPGRTTGWHFPQRVVGRLDCSRASAAPVHPAVQAAPHTEGTTCSHAGSKCGIAWALQMILSVSMCIGFPRRKLSNHADDFTSSTVPVYFLIWDWALLSFPKPKTIWELKGGYPALCTGLKLIFKNYFKNYFKNPW